MTIEKQKEVTQVTQTMNERPVVGSVVVAGGLILAALVFGIFFKQSRGGPRTLSVTGSASEQFTADVAKWRLTLSRHSSDDGQTEGYAQLRADAERLHQRLRAAGVPDSGFAVLPPSAQPQWVNGTRSGYQLQQPIYVISTQPERLEQIATDPGAFTSAGTALDQSSLEYLFSDITKLKQSLLGAATRDARDRAAEIARSAGAEIGDIVAARAGGFQITEPYSTEVSGMGMYNTSTRRKAITVPVRADFRLQ